MTISKAIQAGALAATFLWAASAGAAEQMFSATLDGANATNWSY